MPNGVGSSRGGLRCTQAHIMFGGVKGRRPYSLRSRRANIVARSASTRTLKGHGKCGTLRRQFPPRSFARMSLSSNWQSSSLSAGLLRTACGGLGLFDRRVRRSSNNP